MSRLNCALDNDILWKIGLEINIARAKPHFKKRVSEELCSVDLVKFYGIAERELLSKNGDLPIDPTRGVNWAGEVGNPPWVYGEEVWRPKEEKDFELMEDYREMDRISVCPYYLWWAPQWRFGY